MEESVAVLGEGISVWRLTCRGRYDHHRFVNEDSTSKVLGYYHGASRLKLYKHH